MRFAISFLLAVVLGCTVLVTAAPSVIVIGAGPAGLSAAMELAERGFNVTVYERQGVFGGKARSVNFEGSGVDGRPDWPGEHGFRIFFGFYRHLINTIQRIPVSGAGPNATVFDALVAPLEVLLTQTAFQPISMPASMPDAWHNLTFLWDFFEEQSANMNMTDADKKFFLERSWIAESSCQARWDTQYWNYTWWDFMRASERDEGYQLFAVDALTKTLQGLQSNSSSLRGTGRTVIRILSNYAMGNPIWRLLNAPTTPAWITPMVEYLQSLGVTFYSNATMSALNLGTDGRLESITITPNAPATPYTVTADYYFSAIPCDKLTPLLTPAVLAAMPSLSGVPLLKTSWMNGIQFYLTENVEIAKGHVQTMNSPWALTLISQQQFWPDFNISTMGDGKAKGIVSIDISDFFAPGTPDGPARGRMASECNKTEIVMEVWHQLGMHIGLQDVFDADHTLLHSYHLDDDLVFDPDTELLLSNKEPLWIEVIGDYPNQPNATTELANFFVLGDWCRTECGPASMEAANEAARRAVNALLGALGRTDFCEIFTYPWCTDAVCLAAQELDCLRYDMGLMPLGF